MTPTLEAALRYLPAHMHGELSSGPSEAAMQRCAAHLQAVLQDVSSYLPAHVVRQRLAAAGPAGVSGQFAHGTLMFADISGFTAMSERLSALGREGAEVITRIVNGYFETMLGIVLGYGGDLFKFGGDAMLVAFLDENGALNACRASQAMQQAMGQFAEIQTPQGVFSLRIKIGLGSGLLFTASLGTPERLEFAVMGPALASMAHAEHIAPAGSIVMDEATRQAAGSAITVEPVEEGYYQITNHQSPITNHKPQPERFAWNLKPETLLASLDALSPYLPPSLLARIVASPPSLQESSDQAGMEGEHRLATIAFANFYGIDEMIQALAPGQPGELTDILNRHFRAMQAVIEKYDGIVNKIDSYAVGYRVMAIFGAPRAHEDDPARAVRAALDMQAAAAEFACLRTSAGQFALKQRIGVNTGYVFAGNLGSATRQEYTVMGDEVNLSSRLMGVAGEGQVLLSASTARHVRAQFELEEREPVRVKGKSAPVANCAVLGAARRQAAPAGSRRQVVFVGRQAELAQVRALIDTAMAGQGQVLDLSGEAGVGKTRLVQETAAYAGARGMAILRGEALSYERGVPYLAWMGILRALYGVEETSEVLKTSEVWKREQLVARLAEIGQDAWAPVAAAVFDIPLPDNELTGALEPRLRRERFFDLTLHMLQAQAARQPVLIVVDDVQWADESSLELLAYLARNTAESPVLLAVLRRPEAEAGQLPAGLAEHLALPHCTAIRLAELDEEHSRQLVHAVLQNPHSADDLCAPVVARAQGNPLFLEEVMRTLIETGQARQDEEGRWSLQATLDVTDVPTTLQGLLMSRVDRLEELNRRVLQVAAVIGRTFAYPVLDSVYPYGDLGGTLPTRLEQLVQYDLTQLGRLEPQLEYLFKHTLTQEAAYQSLLYARRRELHRRVGDYIEARYAASLAEHYGTLARHFDEGQAWDKAFAYALQAGRKAQAEYANEAALAYYARALEVAERQALAGVEEQVIEAHEAAGDVCSLVGRYPEAIEHYQIANSKLQITNSKLQIANYRQADLWRKMAKACELQGSFDEALDYLEKGRAALEGEEDCLEMARLYSLMGWVRMRQGSFEQAMALCGQGLYVLADLPKSETRARDEAELYNTMGVTHASQGNPSQAADFFERSARLREQLNDLLGLARSYTNIAVTHWGRGDYAAMREYTLRSLDISEKIGFSYGIAMCYNNLGVLSNQAGEFAQAIEHYRQSLALRQRIGDAAGTAQTYTNLGEVYHAQKDYGLARQYLGAAVETNARLGAQAELVEPYRLLAEIELAEENTDHALQYAERSLQLAAETGNPEELGAVQRVRGQILARAGRTEEAVTALQNSLDSLAQAESRLELAKSHQALGELLAALAGRRQEAESHLARAAEMLADRNNR
ncbi:MAG: tetratricopeptide repeat protein [Thermoflexales bacterium]|nr:tetratricopeptide repeat protein [Thermoflexales bacterium]